MSQFTMQNFKTGLAQNNAKIKEWVNSQIGDIKLFSIEWVDELPTDNISEKIIYMVKDATSTQEKNIYDEFVYKEGIGWERLGSVDAGSIDLSKYYSKEDIDAMLTNYTEEEVIAMVNEIWSE
jgi:hypothetical protein